MGNLLTQVRTSGELASLSEMRADHARLIFPASPLSPARRKSDSR
jgi:hypothetical protein